MTSAAYFILAASCLIFIPVYKSRPSIVARQDALPNVDGAIEAHDAQQTCAVYISIPRSQILTVFFASLLVCLAALQLLFAWFGTLDMPALYVFHAVQFSSPWPSQAAAVLVGLFGVAGLFVFVLAATPFFANPVTLDVQADTEGLRNRGGTKDAFLPWDAIDSITRSAEVDGEIRYIVVGDYARNTITWSTTYALPANASLPLPAVTPNQLAAIVVARSGKQLTIC